MMRKSWHIASYAANASDHLRWKRLDIDDTLSNDEFIPLQQGGPVLAEDAAAAAGQACGFEQYYLHRYGGGTVQLLRRLAYPNRLTGLVQIFGLHPTHLSVMFNLVLEHVHSNFEHLISDLDEPWLEEG